MTPLFFPFYRILLWPALRAAFAVLSLFNVKVRAGLELRRPMADGRAPWLAYPQGSRPVWIHCASGELEYAKPVIAKLKAVAPETKVMVTYFSPTIAKAAREYPGVDFACPLPWDHPRDLAAFIHWHEPRALAIARTDTWPEMLRQARSNAVPTLLFSATLPPDSGRARGFGRWMSKAAFANLNQIFCVSEEDRKTFASLGAGEKTIVAGDTRYDQVRARLKNAKPIRDELFKDIRPETCFVAGSTWSEDEAVLAEVAERFSSRIRFVFVPHEPTDQHLRELEHSLNSRGLKSARYSTAKIWREDEVLLVDKIGILAELYQKGRFAFVGGSFRKTVHSVMEPLAAGALTWVGPKHTNNREALRFRETSLGNSFTAVMVSANAREMIAQLEHALETRAGERSASQIQSEIEKLTGQSQHVVDWLLKT